MSSCDITLNQVRKQWPMLVSTEVHVEAEEEKEEGEGRRK